MAAQNIKARPSCGNINDSDPVDPGAAKAITPIHPMLAASLWVDASSSWMGNVNTMSSHIYGYNAAPAIVNDWVGVGFRNAGDFYFGNEEAGNYARLGLQLGSGLTAAFTPATKAHNARYVSAWYNRRRTGSALMYLRIVPNYQIWGPTEVLLNTLSLGAPVWKARADYNEK